MNFPILLAVSEATSLTLAITIVVAICLMMITAMLKFDVDGALKIWAALGTLTGLVVGSMATYFFSEKNKQEALGRKDAEQAALTARNDALYAQVKATNVEKAKLQGDLTKVTTQDGKTIAPVVVLAQDWLSTTSAPGDIVAPWKSATMKEDGTWKFGNKTYGPGDAILIAPDAKSMSNPEKK